MEKHSLNNLLDRVYELEGLIHLALSRDDDTHRIEELICAKTQALNRFFAENEENAVHVDTEVPEGDNPLAEAEDLISYALEEEEDLKQGSKESESPVRESGDTDHSSEKDGSAELSEAASEGEEEAASTIFEETEDASGEPDEPEMDNMASEQQETGEESILNSESRRSLPVSGDEESEIIAVGQDRNLRSLFSINDRFRFSRELFGGSTRRFDDSLKFLDIALDYNEVEDYFIDDQKLDPEDPVVKEFLDILSRSFAD